MPSSRRDLWIGMAAVAFALVGWLVLIPLGVDVPGSVNILALSPDFWPHIIMIILAACGVMIIVRGWINARLPAPAPATAGNGDIEYFPPKTQLIRIGAAFAALFIFYALTPYLGVVVGAMVLVAVATRILGVRSWVKSLGLAILLPALLYLFFSQVAYIPIPLGLFEELR